MHHGNETQETWKPLLPRFSISEAHWNVRCNGVPQTLLYGLTFKTFIRGFYHISIFAVPATISNAFIMKAVNTVVLFENGVV